MNKNKLFLTITIPLITGVLIGSILTYNSISKYKREDVNKDGKVDALDLLIVQKRIMKEMEGK